MKKNKKKRISIRYLLVAMLMIGLVSMPYVYKNVLPYYLSFQRHVPLIDETGEYDRTDQVGEFLGQVVESDPIQDSELSEVVLGSQDEGVEKWIEVDLSEQKLYAIEDGKRVAEFLVSTGKWGRTPTGTFHIWTKLKSTKMSGGSKALGTYYYLPNVPFTMFFANDQVSASRGFGIHGAYWHSNFGVPMSHGCINMRTRDVEKLYYWANPDDGGARTVRATGDNPGTKVVIYGEAPET